MNMQALMKQAQALQRDMIKAKEEIDKTEFTATSSFVTVTANGKKEILKVTIKPDADFSIDDIELLESMIQVAVNDVNKQIDKMTEAKMGKYTNSMPGLF